MQQSFNILFLTGIHLQFQYVQKLNKWHTQNMLNFDVCLIGGDTANCDQNDKTHDEQQQQKQANRILIQIQQIFGCKMYFIPGNHDPLSYYNTKHKISQDIVSCHSRAMLLAVGLQLTSFGGSVPGYLDKQRSIQKWKGFPYGSNELLSEQCEDKKVFCSEQTGNQKIYLTHCGPFDSETTIDRRKPEEVIYAGATYYNDLLKHQQLLLFLHGHVHHATKFQSRPSQVPLVNPGGLINGQFCYISLVKNVKTKKWDYEQTCFIQLQSQENE